MCTLESKAKRILTDLVFVYNREFADNNSLDYVLDHLEYYNIPRLVEETMAITGGYKFVDEQHFDFSDGTECKTSSVNPIGKLETPTSHSCEITNTISRGGVTKSGDLRVVIYNAVTDSLEYFFIPQSDILGLSCKSPNRMGKISCTYNSKKNKINMLEQYRCETFFEVATRQSSLSESQKLHSHNNNTVLIYNRLANC